MYFTPQRRYTLLTHFFFLLMTVFAVVFAKERFQADGAYYLFKVVNFEKFQVEHQRFILIASQLLPLIGVKLGLSLKTIFILNSLSNIIFFYLVFRYVVYTLHDKAAGIAVIVFQMIGVLYIHYTPMYEIWYGSVLLIPIHALLAAERYRSWRGLLILILLMITVLFSHPLMFIPLTFLLLFDVIGKKKVDRRLLFFTIIIFIGWYTIKKLFLSAYEAGKLSMLDTSWNKAYRDLESGSYYWELVKFFFTFYTVPVIAFFITAGYYFVRREKLKALLVSAFFFGQIFLVNFTHVNDTTLTPYFERMYMPLIAIVFLPFLYDIFMPHGRNIAGVSVLILVIAWRMGRMIDVGLEYKKRTAEAEKAISLAECSPGSKHELNPSDVKWCMNWVDWSFTMESMLRSAANNPAKTVTIATWFDFEEDHNRDKLRDDTYMMRRWEIMPDTTANPKYFHIQHGKYTQLDAVCE